LDVVGPLPPSLTGK
jgi:hypothetical protein